MVPFDSLLRIFSCMTTIDEFRQRTVKMALSGLFRDLRGILSSANNHRTYALFFDWLYPNYIAMLYRTAELWFDEPQVLSKCCINHWLTVHLLVGHSANAQIPCGARV